MTPERMRLVEEIFLEAAGLRGQSRRALLDARCNGDETLRAEVESLLNHDTGDEGQVLSAPLVAPAILPRNLVDSEAARLKPGTRVASYTITGVLGEGGMSVVYVAEQESPRRTVALKLIRPGIASGAVLRRLEMEAELLGRLKHPGIAQIFEAGRADYGLGPQPYFAMEYVDGPPLHKYAQDHSLTPRRRLALMLKVCQAVEHAHQRGVIHRDLKPANILVDSSGQPRILDLGVARATNSDLGIVSLHTSFGQLIGTLPYMSPEQISGNTDQVDTRSDVYAIGVVLYQLLAGRLPHDLDSRSIPDAARIIADEEPRPLGSLHRELRGDIETIVAKAMAKDKARRYQSASALGEDIRRFLANEPIEAKRDSAIYVLRKQLRRFRTLAAAICLVIILLSAFSVYSTYQADQNRRLAQSEREATRQANLLREQSERQAERLRRGFYFNRIGFAQAAHAARDADRMTRVLGECPQDLRGWEWSYLKRLSDSSAATLTIREAGPGGAILSADGGTVISWAADKPIVIHRTESGEIAGSLPQGPAPAAALPSPDGGSIIISAGDDRVQLWAVGSAEPLWSVKPLESGARAFAFTHDGDAAVVLGADGNAALLDTRDGSTIRIITGVADRPTCAAISPDSAWLAVGDGVGELSAFDLPAGRKIRTVQAHSGGVSSIAFAPNSRHITTGGADANVRLWSLSAESLAFSGFYRAHDSRITAVAFSPDGRRIATAGTEGVVRIINAGTAEIVGAHFGHVQAVTSLVYLPDQPTLLSASHDGTMKRWDLGRSGDNVTARASGPTSAVAISPDGRLVYTGGRQGALQCWQLRGMTELPGFDGPREAVRSIAVSPDGTMLAYAGTGESLTLHDALTGRPLRTLGGRIGPQHGVDFVGDGMLACCTADGSVIAWDAATGEQRWATRLDPGGVPAIATDARAGIIAAAGHDGRVFMLRASDGSTVGSFPAFDTGRVLSLILFDGGQRLLAASRGADTRVFDTQSGRELGSLQGHKGDILACAVSPDGSRIVTGSLDNIVRIWDAAAGEEILALRYHIGGVCAVRFTPDGSRIVTAGEDAHIRVWSDGR